MPIIKIHNIETNEIIERDMTAAEIEQFENNEKTAKAETDSIQLTLAAKMALLEKLGITEEEAKLLFS